MVSIMPGMESRAPERTETSRGLSLPPNTFFIWDSIKPTAVFTSEVSERG